jgi:hypothetical protein
MQTKSLVMVQLPLRSKKDKENPMAAQGASEIAM